MSIPVPRTLRRDLLLRRGVTFDLTMIWRTEAGTPFDFSACTARMLVRATPRGTVLLTLTNGAGITLAADGTVDIIIADEVTAAIAWDAGVYDLLVTDATGRTYEPLLRGRVRVEDTVSAP